MNPLARSIFKTKVRLIRENPRLCGDWGTLQEYLRDLFSSDGLDDKLSSRQSLDFHKLPDGRTAHVLTSVIKGKVCMTIMVPKVGCKKLPPERLLPEDVEKQVFPLPSDLQAIILG